MNEIQMSEQARNLTWYKNQSTLKSDMSGVAVQTGEQRLSMEEMRRLAEVKRRRENGNNKDSEENTPPIIIKKAVEEHRERLMKKAKPTSVWEKHEIEEAYRELVSAIFRAHTIAPGHASDVNKLSEYLDDVKHAMRLNKIEIPEFVEELEQQKMQKLKEEANASAEQMIARQDDHQEIPQNWNDIPVPVNLDLLHTPTAINMGILINIQLKTDAGRREEYILDWLKKIAEARTQQGGAIDENEVVVLTEALNNHLRLAEAFNNRTREKHQEDAYAAGINTLYGERKLRPEEKQLISFVAPQGEADPLLAEREKLFNRIFDSVDIAQASDWNTAFDGKAQWEKNEFFSVLNSARNNEEDPYRKNELSMRVNRYTEQLKLREFLHNSNYVVRSNGSLEQLSGYLNSLTVDQIDTAFKLNGVTAAAHFYEQALIRIREENGGWIPYDAIIGDRSKGIEGRLDMLARKYFDAALVNGSIRNVNGTVIPQMEEWEKSRALTMGRNMNLVTGRTLEIVAATVLLPKNGINASTYMEDIIKEIRPTRQMWKYNIGNLQKDFLAVRKIPRHKDPKDWSYNEIIEFHELSEEMRYKVINGLAGKDNVIGGDWEFTNIGSMYYNTNWRTDWGDGFDSVASALHGIKENDPRWQWIGSRIIMEHVKGDLKAGGEKGRNARRLVGEQMEKIVRLNPTRLFMNVQEVREGVMRDMGYQAADDPRLQKDLDELIILQEEANNRGLEGAITAQQHGIQGAKVVDRAGQVVDANTVNLDYSLVQDDPPLPENATQEQRLRWENAQTKVARLQRLTGAINRRFDRNDYRKKLANNQLAGAETEDMPQGRLYEYTKTGGNSFARRWRDIGYVGKGSGLFIENVVKKLHAFKSPEEVAHALDEVFKAIEIHDHDGAKKFVMTMAEGIAKYFAKDSLARMPFGFGTLFKISGGNESYAQLAFGRHAMAWDELEVNEFTRQLRVLHIIGEKDQHEFQNKVGGRKIDVFRAFMRTIIPLIFLLFLYNIGKETGAEAGI